MNASHHREMLNSPHIKSIIRDANCNICNISSQTSIARHAFGPLLARLSGFSRLQKRHAWRVLLHKLSYINCLIKRVCIKNKIFTTKEDNNKFLLWKIYFSIFRDNVTCLPSKRDQFCISRNMIFHPTCCRNALRGANERFGTFPRGSVDEEIGVNETTVSMEFLSNHIVERVGKSPATFATRWRSNPLYRIDLSPLNLHAGSENSPVNYTEFRQQLEKFCTGTILITPIIWSGCTAVWSRMKQIDSFSANWENISDKNFKEEITKKNYID